MAMVESGRWVSNIKTSILLKKGRFSYVRVFLKMRITHLHGSAHFTIHLSRITLQNQNFIKYNWYGECDKEIEWQDGLWFEENERDGLWFEENEWDGLWFEENERDGLWFEENEWDGLWFEVN